MGCHQAEEQEAELLGKGLGCGEGRNCRVPVSSERPCRRGRRTEDLDSPETLVGLSHLLDGQSHHTARPPTHAHSRKAGPKPGIPGHSGSSPTSLQPQLLQVARPPPTLPSHPSLHVFDPSHVRILCLDHHSLSLFPPCKPGFPVALLSLVADAALMPLSHPTGHQHTFPLLALGLLWRRWRRGQHRPDHRSQGVQSSAAASAKGTVRRWTNPSFPAPQRHNFEAPSTVSQRAPAGLSPVTIV